MTFSCQNLPVSNFPANAGQLRTNRVWLRCEAEDVLPQPLLPPPPPTPGTHPPTLKKDFPTPRYFPRISRFIQKSEKSPKKIHQIFHKPIHFPRPPLAPAAQAHYACIQPPLISHNLLHTTSDICWPRLMRSNTNIFFSCQEKNMFVFGLLRLLINVTAQHNIEIQNIPAQCLKPLSSHLH